MSKEKNINAIVEIGPGKGALTKKICHLTPNYLGIEKDKKMLDHVGWHDYQKVFDTKHKRIINQDALTLTTQNMRQYSILPSRTLCVGNLPYYITSPLLRHFFNGEMKFA